MSNVSEELDRFVREALARGIPRPEIETALATAGWSREKIAQALDAYAAVDFPVPVPRPQPYVSAREAFLYLVLFTTLFLSAFHLGSILFELIEWAFPDAAGSDYSESSVRWSVAFLVVAFPVFLFLTIRMARERAQDPSQRSSKVRKWLTYLTLFVAAGFLIGDLVCLVYYFLQGELTVRFLLKVLVVAALAGSGFGYYLHDLGKDEP